MTTLKQMIEYGMRLSAHCSSYDPRCGHWAELRLENLVQRFGWEFDLIDGHDLFCSQLACSRCGTRNPSLRVAGVQRHQSGPSSYQMDTVSVPAEEALRHDLELRAHDREINAAYYEAKGDRVGRIRKFGRR